MTDRPTERTNREAYREVSLPNICNLLLNILCLTLHRWVNKILSVQGQSAQKSLLECLIYCYFILLEKQKDRKVVLESHVPKLEQHVAVICVLEGGDQAAA